LQSEDFDERLRKFLYSKLEKMSENKKIGD
jgi:hypothetical protein